VTVECVISCFALYIKCAAADTNVTDGSEQWVFLCNLNYLFTNKGIYT